MFSSNLLSRAGVLAGLVAALSLPHTARAQSVTPGRALLNQVHAGASPAPAAVQSAMPGIDGERALLNRSHTTVPQPVESAPRFTAEASVDGVKALLNRSSS